MRIIIKALIIEVEIRVKVIEIIKIIEVTIGGLGVINKKKVIY